MEVTSSQIARWLQPQEILLNVEVTDRGHALETLATAIGRRHGLEPAPISRALWRREQAGSTALGDGFAIPHAQIEGLVQPLTLFMRTHRSIEFNAPDGKPVSDFLAIMVPHDGARESHLQLLAMVARLFSNQAFRRQLDGAPDAQAAEALFQSGIVECAQSQTAVRTST